MEQEINIDSQSRTSLMGFNYSRGDPANRCDPNPTDFSYIDFAFSNQLTHIERELKAPDSSDYDQLMQKRAALLQAIEGRKDRKFSLRSHFVVKQISSRDLEESGEILSFIALFVMITFVGFILAKMDVWVGTTTVIAGTLMLTTHMLHRHFDLNPYSEVELLEEEAEEL
jgi:hypothetical protein